MEPTRILLFVFLIHSLRKLTVLSYNILVLPRPVYSHVRSVKVMMDILINEYQHNITLLLTDSVAKHPSLKDIRAEIVTYDKDGKFTKNLDELSSKAYENGFNSMGPLSMVPYIQSMAVGFTHSIMTDSEIYNKLEGHYSGIPEFPVFPLLDTTSFFSRLKNVGVRMGLSLVGCFSEYVIYPKDIVHRYVSTTNLDKFYKLANGFSLYLLDQDGILDYPRPVLSNIVPVGGLALSDIVHPLPMEIQRHVDTAHDGFVVATFGSTLKTTLEEFRKKLYQAFKNIPKIHFVLKIGETYFQDKNILQTPWVPQNDLLGNKRVKAFITHCGNSGQYEALYHGVPMVAIPIFGDQVYNADRIVMKSFGVKLDLVAFTSGDLEKSIREVVYNDTYSRKIKLASEMYRSKPQNASQRAAYWVHHVTTYGSVHLRSPSHSLPAYKYLALDVVLFVFLCFLLLLGAVVTGVCVLCRFCCSIQKKF
ncbi:2-hydroxyacylsphingosine 1-beta-galactosyltransferase-like [Ostrea edulis]|uniref:2-hydroxyacylsphingosine 1-beta-galactosyltransferase-like n=1 Tax=Ostrea edulis TaxID=37623 RepID=UPI0024AE9F8B|nr:2-hydroxyacylsphingosine 1-beta-galactosyltransferase-like [Ostrea edulis]